MRQAGSTKACFGPGPEVSEAGRQAQQPEVVKEGNKGIRGWVGKLKH